MSLSSVRDSALRSPQVVENSLAPFCPRCYIKSRDTDEKTTCGNCHLVTSSWVSVRDHSWACPVCTVFNESRSLSCAVCGETLKFKMYPRAEVPINVLKLPQRANTKRKEIETISRNPVKRSKQSFMKQFYSPVSTTPRAEMKLPQLPQSPLISTQKKVKATVKVAVKREPTNFKKEPVLKKHKQKGTTTSVGCKQHKKSSSSNTAAILSSSSLLAACAPVSPQEQSTKAYKSQQLSEIDKLYEENRNSDFDLGFDYLTLNSAKSKISNQVQAKWPSSAWRNLPKALITCVTGGHDLVMLKLMKSAYQQKPQDISRQWLHGNFSKELKIVVGHKEYIFQKGYCLLHQIVIADVREDVRQCLLKSVLTFAEECLDVNEKRQLLRNRSSMSSYGQFRRSTCPARVPPEVYECYTRGDSCPYRAERRWCLRGFSTSKLKNRTFKESLASNISSDLTACSAEDGHGGLMMAGYNTEGRSAVAIALVHADWEMVKTLAMHAECDLYRSDFLYSNALVWLVPMVRLGSWVANLVPSLSSLFTSLEYNRGCLSPVEISSSLRSSLYYCIADSAVNNKLSSNETSELESWKAAAEVLFYGGFSASWDSAEGGSPPWLPLTDLSNSDVATRDCMSLEANLTSVHVAVLAQHYELLSTSLAAAAAFDETHSVASSSTSQTASSFSSETTIESGESALCKAVNTVGKLGNRELKPLHESIRVGWVEGACLLLNRGADPNEKESLEGYSALSVASIMARCGSSALFITLSGNKQGKAREVFQASHSMFALLMRSLIPVQLNSRDRYLRTAFHFLCAPFGYYSDDVIDLDVYKQSNHDGMHSEFYKNTLLRIELLTMLITSPKSHSTTVKILLESQDGWGTTPLDLMKRHMFEIASPKCCEGKSSLKSVDPSSVLIEKKKLKPEDKVWLFVAIQISKFYNNTNRLLNVMRYFFKRSKISPSDVAELEYNHRDVNTPESKSSCHCVKSNKPGTDLAIMKNGSFIISGITSNDQEMCKVVEQELNRFRNSLLSNKSIHDIDDKEEDIICVDVRSIANDFVYISHSVEGSSVHIAYDTPPTFACPCTVKRRTHTQFLKQ